MQDGFFKVAAASFPIKVGDCAANARAAIETAAAADQAGVRLLVLPELCLTGCTCGDLFLQPVLLDGAHNAHGAAALERSLTALFGAEKLTLVAGILADKDYGDMLGLLAPHAKRLFLVPPPSPRALSAAEAQAAARQYFPDALGFDTVRAGLDAAMAAQAEDGAPVVCFGSLYMAGEVLDYFAP